MPLRTQQRQAIEAIDKRIKEYDRKPKSGVVKKIHGSSVDLRVQGSPQLIRNVKVLGDIAQVKVEDTVILNWDERRPRVIAPGSSSALVAKKLAGSISAGSVYVDDDADYFAGETVESVLAEIAAGLKILMDVTSQPSLVGPSSLVWNWDGPNLELGWSHSGEGRAVYDFRVRIFNVRYGAEYRADYIKTTHYTWTLDMQLDDTGGDLNPSVWVEVCARDYSLLCSSSISATCVNPVPGAPTGATYNFPLDLSIMYEWSDDSDIKEMVAELLVQSI